MCYKGQDKYQYYSSGLPIIRITSGAFLVAKPPCCRFSKGSSNQKVLDARFIRPLGSSGLLSGIRGSGYLLRVEDVF